MEEYLTAKQVAKYLQVKPLTCLRELLNCLFFTSFMVINF